MNPTSPARAGPADLVVGLAAGAIAGVPPIVDRTHRPASDDDPARPPAGGSAGPRLVPYEPEPDAAAAADTAAVTGLVRRAQQGDRPAFEQLVRDTARALYARLYLEVGDRDQTEDLVQETYLTAWRSIGQLTDVPDPGAFRRWLFAIARTVRIDAGRRRARKKRGGARPAATGLAAAGGSTGGDDPLAGVPDPGLSPDEALARQERHDQVLGLLRALPDEWRLPIAMRYLAGADHDTVCRQLGITNGSLRGLLNRGMARLRQLLDASEA